MTGARLHLVEESILPPRLLPPGEVYYYQTLPLGLLKNMIHGALAQAEAQHAAYAASVHGMAFGVTPPVPPPVPNPIIVEIGNAGDAEDDMPLAISGFGLSNPVKKRTDDSENEIDDTIAQPCKVNANTNDADDHGARVYCKECQTWLNGIRQYEDHKTGKKHEKNMQKARRGNASSSVEVQSQPIALHLALAESQQESICPSDAAASCKRKAADM